VALYKLLAIGSYPSAANWSFTQHVTSSLSLAAAGSAWNTAVSALWTSLTARLPTVVSLTQTVVVERDPATGHQLQKLATANVTPGTDAGQPLPAEVTCCVSKQTVTPTREGRGRLYLPAFSVDQMSAGFFSAACVTGVVTAVKAMYDSLVGASMTPIIYGLRSHVLYNMSGFRVGNVPDSQRGRRRKQIEAYTSSAL
jgi:hypothetical protein